jgi:hypothetical protein
MMIYPHVHLPAAAALLIIAKLGAFVQATPAFTFT